MHNPAEDYLNQHAEKGKDHSSATTRSTDEPEEDAVESRKDEAEDEGTKVNKRRGAGGRPRAVKRSRRGKRTQASSTTKGEGHGQSDDEDEQEQELQRSQLVRESDDDYTEKDDDDEDEMEEEEVDMEEEETQKQTKRRRGEGGGAGKMRNVAEGVVTRKRAKSLTLAEDKKEANERRENSPNGRKRKSMVLPTVAGHEKGKKNKLDASKRNEAEERREHGRVKSDRGGVEERKKKSKKASKIEPSEDDDDREEEIQGSDDDEEDQDGDAGEDEDGDEIPKNHVNQKWFERLEDVKGWQKRTNLNRPNRKQDATLGRFVLTFPRAPNSPKELKLTCVVVLPGQVGRRAAQPSAVRHPSAVASKVARCDRLLRQRSLITCTDIAQLLPRVGRPEPEILSKAKVQPRITGGGSTYVPSIHQQGARRIWPRHVRGTKSLQTTNHPCWS
jgi:hypothetical protein